MKKNLLILLSVVFGFAMKAQTILYSNTFNTSLGTATAVNGSSGNWVWSNSCAQSSLTGHSGPGHAIFQGSGCQFGNGSSTVSGDLVTPSVAIGALGGTLTFNYFILNECGSGTCFYDVLTLDISTNNGTSYTTLLNSNTSPGGLSNTSGWATVTLSLLSYTNQAIKIRFNFNSVDGVANAYDGIYVDDINVIGACSINMSAVSGGNTVSPGLCSGNSLTLTTNAVSNYSWSNGSTSSSIVITPTVTTSYSLTATSVSNCVSSSAITVTVSGSTPVLSVTTSTNNICLGKTVTLTATGANNYTWTSGVLNGVSFSPSVTSSYTVSGSNGCGTSTALTSITVAPLSVSILASPTIVCSGQQALLTVAAAANNFTWQPINSIVSTNTIFVSPQSTTGFTVSAGDGTCSGVASITVVAKPIPTVNISASSTLVCQGDPVTLTANGGVSYTWTPNTSNSTAVTVNPVTPTIYSVSASNSLGCVSGNFVAIITNPSPTLNVTTSNNLICNGDAATITVNGASSYTWMTGSNSNSIIVSPSASTVYAVSGTSNNCNSTQTINIDVFSPNISITGTTTICAGKTATLTGSGANSYNWSNGIPNNVNVVSPAVNTTYTLTTLTTTNGVNCSASKTIQVTVNPNPTVTAISSRTAMCKAENNTITASGATTYSWNTTATTSSFVITPSLVTTNFYTVTGIGSNGCQNTATLQVKINACTGIKDINLSNNTFNVYPNPNNGAFYIETNAAINLVIINQLGQIIKSIDLDEKANYRAYLEGLNSGLYFVKEANSTNSKSFKIIVNN